MPPTVPSRSTLMLPAPPVAALTPALAVAPVFSTSVPTALLMITLPEVEVMFRVGFVPPVLLTNAVPA